jgi:DNA transformation protein
MGQLSNRPNIGRTLEIKLNEAGIFTPAELVSLGAEHVFLRLSVDDESACFNMICALEGAIQGIRWHHLQKIRKEELKAFLKLKRINIK